MAANNSCVFMGNLTRDPEVRFVGNDKTAVANFDLAINSGYGDKKKTHFLSFVAWGKTAEFVQNNFGKGKGMLVSAEATVESWKSEKDGVEQARSKVVFRANDVTFTGGGKKKDEESSAEESVGENTDDNSVPF